MNSVILKTFPLILVAGVIVNYSLLLTLYEIGKYT